MSTVVSNAIQELYTVTTQAIDFIMGNEILRAIFVASLIYVAFSVVKRAKDSATGD